MSAAIIKRLRAMDAAELRFRAAAAVRSRVERARTALATPTWRREMLRLSVDPSLAAALAPAREALERQDWLGAHLALAKHFRGRNAPFHSTPGIWSRSPPGFARDFPTATQAAGRSRAEWHVRLARLSRRTDRVASRLASRRRPQPESATGVLGVGALPRSRVRRSQDHLGAESASALPDARPRLRTHRRRSLLSRVRHADHRAGSRRIRRCSGRIGQACWNSRSAACHGCGRCTSSPAR